MLVRDINLWEEVVDEILTSDRPYFGFDTETVGERAWPEKAVVGFSLGWYDKFGLTDCYVPLLHRDEEDQLLPDQLNLDQVRDGLCKIMESGREVVMHGGKYDIQIAVLMGFEIPEYIFDTMIASWLLNTDGVGSRLQVFMGKGKLGLKDLEKHVLKLDRKGLSEIAPKINGELRVDRANLEEASDYAGQDANSVLRLYEKYKPELEAEGKLFYMYDRLYREFNHELAEMEMFGVELDVKFLAELQARAEEIIEDTMFRLFTERSDIDFPEISNFGQLKKLLKGWMDLERRFALDRSHKDYPRNEKGNPTGKGTARKNLLAELGFENHPVVDKIKDAALLPWLLKYPHLAHKVWNPNSDPVLNKVLFEEERLPPIGERGKNGLYSTKADYVKKWAKKTDNKVAKLLLRLRKIEKLHGTYLVGMQRQVSPDGRLRGRFNITGTRSGRLSSSDPNLQNQPKSAEFPIRRAFVAGGTAEAKVEILEWYTNSQGENTKPKRLTVETSGGGYEIYEKRVKDWYGKNPPMVMGVGDYSQLEIRLLAHASQDEVLIDAIWNDVDIHALTARAVFDEIPDDYPLDKIPEDFPKLRGDAKPVNFGVLYGMGPNKLANTLGISVEAATDIIEVRYMSLYKGVAAWIAEMHEHARLYGYVPTAWGRRRHLPAANFDLRLAEHHERKAIKRLASKAMRQAQNSPIQGFAADVMNLAMRDIRRWMMWNNFWGTLYKLLLQVHDEIIWESHPEVSNELMDVTVEKMENVFQLAVPIKVDAALGQNWEQTKE